MLSDAPDLLPEQEWTDRARAHASRVRAWTAGHAERASRGVPHPVEDFLFTYYSQRPGRLARWHPGPGIGLLGETARERLGWKFHRLHGDAVVLDTAAFLAARGAAVRHIRALLAATASRPPQLGCFGLHEWAMVHRVPDGAQRHEQWPLRLGAAGTDAVVEASALKCTHFDAFRFFTPPARPLNATALSRETQVETEQPGCLHATMDLYKFSYKLAPAVPGELVAACFALARDVRALDMAASPYDLSALGLTPVRVETPAGRAEYTRRQLEFTERAAPLRAALVEVCDQVLAGGEAVGGGH